jgi:hypothetical protein
MNHKNFCNNRNTLILSNKFLIKSMMFGFYRLLGEVFWEVENIALVLGLIITKFQKTCIHTLREMIFWNHFLIMYLMGENWFSKMNCRRILYLSNFFIWNIINSCWFWESLIWHLELYYNSIDFSDPIIYSKAYKNEYSFFIVLKF